jgi:hypothetical protein
MPENGFPKNKLLFKLLQKKPNEVYRGKLVENLRSQLDTIRNGCIKLGDEMKNSKNKIKEHCEKVKKLIEIEEDEIRKKEKLKYYYYYYFISSYFDLYIVNEK